MRIFLACFFSFLSALVFSQTAPAEAGEPLFKIERNGLLGFIDRSGKEVIEPKFRDAGNLTFSLAPAWLGGTWGFINRKGEFVIRPVYDYAMPFSEGYAVVWQWGAAFCINEKGEKIWELPAHTIDAGVFINGVLQGIRLENGDRENFLLKNNGEIVFLGDLEYGEGWTPPYPVLTRHTQINDRLYTEYAVQDSTTGQLLVPFGRYRSIDGYIDGFAEVAVGDFPNNYNIGLINRKGDLICILPKGSFAGAFSEGLMAVETPADTNDTASMDRYITWYDTTGQIVRVEKQNRKARSYEHGRTFVHNGNTWCMLDKSGRQLGPHRFADIPFEGFIENRAIVMADSTDTTAVGPALYGVIDTMGNYLIAPQFTETCPAGFQKEGLLVAVPAASRKNSTKKRLLWGLVNEQGRWVFQPKFTGVSVSGFLNGLVYAEIDSLYGYVDTTGTFVWSAVRQEEGLLQPDNLNMGEMREARYFASRAPSHPFKTTIPPGEPGIWVDTNEKTRFQKKYEGFQAYVYNTGVESVPIAAMGGKLLVTIQALNPQGTWQPIEYFSPPLCGNSYYPISLEANECWTFPIPVYDGDFDTSLRLAFTWKTKITHPGETRQTIYSNSFHGKINPAQFWRQVRY